jgi:hypothetical protein
MVPETILQLRLKCAAFLGEPYSCGNLPTTVVPTFAPNNAAWVFWHLPVLQVQYYILTPKRLHYKKLIRVRLSSMAHQLCSRFSGRQLAQKATRKVLCWQSGFIAGPK